MKTLYTPYIDVTVNADWSDWQTYPNGRPNPLYSEQAKDWKVDGLIFGFITLATQNNTACWAAQPTMPLDWARPLADDLHSDEKEVIISFGGAANQDISNSFNVDQLVETYTSVINDYHAHGLDFDLENGLFDIDKICEALQKIQASYPQVTLSFTLPTLPSGLTDEGLVIVKRAVDAGLKFVINGMAMDYYNPNYANQMGKAARDAATAIKNQLALFYPSLKPDELYRKVAVTPMIGLNDDKSMFTFDDAIMVGEFSRQNSLYYLGEWSLNRDNPSSSSYVNPTSSGNPQQKVSGEYAQHFLQGQAK
ncbi:chitinase [Enterobacter sp. Bisph1]|uniref:chitinase n=1 Tax=Enterobacter sp. Bisph1 TaxID=1274399 RepID=UPI00057BE519|nr:chitinase [Enterobacter sp. Bisph1]